jgi:hypothetical protein
MRGMDRSTPSKGAGPRDERERPGGAAVRSDRERRRAEREVRRALSERRAVGTMVAAAACAHLFWFAVLAGDLRVRKALDELPGFVRAELEQHVAVTVAIRMDRRSVTELAFGFVPSSLFPPICGLPGKSIPIVVEPVVLPEPARPADAPAAPSTPRPEPVLPDKQPAGS